jgi:hypothetical protein
MRRNIQANLISAKNLHPKAMQNLDSEITYTRESPERGREIDERLISTNEQRMDQTSNPLMMD